MAKKKLTLEEKLEEAIISDVPYKTPNNWIWIKALTVLDVRYGKNLATKKLINEGYPVFGANGYIGFFSEYNIEKEKVLISCRGAYSGKVNIASGKSFITNNSLIIEQKHKKISNKFLYYMIEAMNRENLVSGTAQPQVTVKAFDDFTVVVPPIDEQKRIVNKIENLFEKLDKAKELVEEAREGFENRKAAILEKAFRGELTREWREKNSTNGSETKENILKQNKSIKKKFDLAEVNLLFDIPEEWKWYKLRDLCEKFKYGTSKKSKEEGKVPVLRMGNLQKGKLEWKKLVYTDDLEEIEKYELYPGDLLFNRTNSPELVGKTSIYSGEREAIYAGYLIRVRTLKVINSKYINYFMNSIFAKERCMEIKSDGVSQSNINAEKLGDFDIPLAPLSEQKEIVRLLEKLLKKEDEIEKATEILAQIELIKKSILAKAFRGELGTNDPEEESAMELLKEILSEK